tara:strand:- start:629 stop:886 length:258 start_codon:yes stop_codon:yes gene_type:complete
MAKWDVPKPNILLAKGQVGEDGFETVFYSGANKIMKCWHCEDELIWGGDHDTDGDEIYSMVTNLTCPKCESYVEVWYPRKPEDES